MKNGMIIVNYNDYSSTKELINNIQSYQILDKIVVVDNHSTDDSMKQLKKLKVPNLKILEVKENKGYAYAINYGSKYLIKELGTCNLIISNPDVMISKEEDIKELLSLLKDKKVGMVGPTILEHETLNRGWKNPSPCLDALMNLPYIHRFIRKKFIKYKEDYYQKETSQVDVISGCFFCISSETLEKIDFLDENTFLYYEENILSKRLQQIGLSCIVSNHILIIHNHSVTIDKNLNKLKKYKVQKESQYYFQTTYQHASGIERALLKGTRALGKSILSVYYYLLDRKHKK